MRLTSISLLILIFISACKLDGYDAGPINLDNKQYFLKEITDGIESRATYEYDDDFRLIRQVFYENRTYSYEFEYTESRHPDLFKIYFGDTHRITVYLTYEDDMLMESRALSPSGKSVLFVERFGYDNLGRMTKRIVYPGIIGLYAEVEYTWIDNNITEIKAEFLEFTETIRIDYDDKLNPMREVYRNIGYDHHASMPITHNNWANKVVTTTSYPG
jgi:hypothetical protein